LHQLQLRHHPAPWRALQLYGTAKETRPRKGINFVKFAIAQAVTIIYGYASYLPGAAYRCSLAPRRRSGSALPPPLTDSASAPPLTGLCTRASITRGEWVSGRVGERASACE